MKKESELAHIPHIQELTDNATHILDKKKLKNAINNRPKKYEIIWA